MAKKKRGDAHGGGHGWFVTFADLMGLMMSFFVMVAAYSTQDKIKLQQMAGSMREAFGQSRETRLAGVIEIGGMPNKDFMKELSPTSGPEDVGIASERHDELRRQGPELSTHDNERTPIDISRHFATAAATLRQAWQAMPEIAALSQNILFEETPDGLAIQLVDQDGRSMFPEGSRYPYERARLALQALAPAIARLPNPVLITGHTTARRIVGRAGYTNWDLSSDRANSVRQILMESGLPSERISGVVGKADTEPYIQNNPLATPNSRVTILLQYEAPPLPRSLHP